MSAVAASEETFHVAPSGYPEAPRDIPRVRAVLKQFRVVDTDYRAKGVQRLAAIYRQTYGLDDSVRASLQRAHRWKATIFQGRVIAVFGEVWHSDRAMEISDAYCEPTRYGRMALYAQALWYKGRVDEGLLDEVDFLILAQNQGAWQAVVKETQMAPWALIWRYRKQ